MSVLSDLMKRRSTEIFVNFMFEEINRFINHPEQGHNFDGLFGCEEWRQAASGWRERKKFIVDLYRDQLRQRAGARHVRSFEMRNQRNATDYFLLLREQQPSRPVEDEGSDVEGGLQAADIRSPMPQISDRMFSLSPSLIVARCDG